MFKPLPSDDPMMRKPDITLAKQVLDWEPKIMLEEGLKKTIAYFDELIKAFLTLLIARIPLFHEFAGLLLLLQKPRLQRLLI